MQSTLFIRDYPRTIVLKPSESDSSSTSTSNFYSTPNAPLNAINVASNFAIVLENVPNTNKASLRFQPSKTLEFAAFRPLLRFPVFGFLGISQVENGANHKEIKKNDFQNQRH